ncbi:hypothetical protein ACQ0P8_06785 [Halodesulfovibrio aestuarii]|uniref:Uncharacterized protein n=1 Tax=Halodesulfovibrio aestuarii TaxID=126333 RepID=A0A8G2FCC6_9BACT|nr:hypothetical protein [Halodesulfovibrio aestuarii]SHJ76780.1 hypothetical protein SAMN05660830_03176 [Halodesulfovibrio aestuarii]
MTASQDLPEIKENYTKDEVLELLETIQHVSPSSGWLTALLQETNFVSILQELKEVSLAELKHDEGITKETLIQLTSSLNISVNAVRDLAQSMDSDEIKLQAINRIFEELNKTQQRQVEVTQSNQKCKVPFGVIAFGCFVILGVFGVLVRNGSSNKRGNVA